MHRFLTTVSLHFRFDQKCMLVELGACVTECLKSFNSPGEFSMRCPRRTPTHLFCYVHFDSFEYFLHINFAKKEIKITCVVLIVALIYIYIVLYLRYRSDLLAINTARFIS